MTSHHNVAVQKDIVLASGESISTFTQKLRDAGRKYVKQKLNLTNTKDNSCGCYPIEIFSKSIIFDVYQYGPNIDDDKRVRYYAVAYSRKDDGTFEFSTLTEVERVVGYQAKETAAVTKAGKALLPSDGDGDSQPTKKSLEGAPGWAQTAKSLWGGVL